MAANLDRLCDVCSQVPFLQHYRHRLPDSALCSYAEAKQRPQCPLCRVLSQRIEAACSAWKIRPIPNVQCRAKSQLLSGRSDVGSSPRPSPPFDNYRLAIATEPPLGFLRNGLGVWHPEVGRSDLLMTFDVMDRLSECTDHTKDDFAMKRRLVPDILDYQLLTDWLRHERNPNSGEDGRSAQSGQLARLATHGRFRLFDVQQGRVVTASESMPYAALSYVVGGRTEALERFNCAGRKQEDSGAPEILDTLLPSTIKDAGTLMRGLGRRYLWNDVLCIDQRSTEDRAEIIAAMSDIYKNAEFTIIAATGEHADAGLPGVTRASRVADRAVARIEIDGKNFTLVDHKESYLHRIMQECRWSSRGWCYQEHMLSPRCLFFATDEVYYLGKTGMEREAWSYYSKLALGFKYERHAMQEYRPATPADLAAGDNVRDWDSPHDRMINEQPLTFFDYRDLVHDYTLRSLTVPADRLSAFAGILSACRRTAHNNQQDAIIDGIPLRFLPQAVMWRPAASRRNPYPVPDRLREKDIVLQRPPASWSWIGWTGEIFMEDSEDSSTQKEGSLMGAELINSRHVLMHPVSVPPDHKWASFWIPRPLPKNFEARAFEHAGGGVLLLWTTVVQCHLTTEAPQAGRYNARPLGRCEQTINLGYLVLDTAWVDSKGTNARFELAVIGGQPFFNRNPRALNGRIFSILIDRKETFVERVALVDVDRVEWEVLVEADGGEAKWELLMVR